MDRIKLSCREHNTREPSTSIDDTGVQDRCVRHCCWRNEFWSNSNANSADGAALGDFEEARDEEAMEAIPEQIEHGVEDYIGSDAFTDDRLVRERVLRRLAQA